MDSVCRARVSGLGVAPQHPRLRLALALKAHALAAREGPLLQLLPRETARPALKSQAPGALRAWHALPGHHRAGTQAPLIGAPGQKTRRAPCGQERALGPPWSIASSTRGSLPSP